MIKITLAVLTIVALALPVTGLTYTFSGPIDPIAVHEWEIIGRSQVFGDGMYFLVGKNPDPDYNIQYVLFKIYLPAGRMLYQYSYYKNKNLVVYRARGRGEYARVDPDPGDYDDARQWLDVAPLYGAQANTG